ncbi:unnamed protein product [Blepharisma stoltei]|uniref:Uncharacterized protein n=1 Tax=Blepharisma stoltei TaxID=1481888 RepID=A0AAU9JF80_9CILI|nr:unnamed protein product [Blepharisma stoltei]
MDSLEAALLVHAHHALMWIAINVQIVEVGILAFNVQKPLPLHQDLKWRKLLAVTKENLEAALLVHAHHALILIANTVKIVEVGIIAFNVQRP